MSGDMCAVFKDHKAGHCASVRSRGEVTRAESWGMSGSKSHRALWHRSVFRKDMKVSHLSCLHMRCFALDTMLNCLWFPRPHAVSLLCAWAFASPAWSILSPTLVPGQLLFLLWDSAQGSFPVVELLKLSAWTQFLPLLWTSLGPCLNT